MEMFVHFGSAITTFLNVFAIKIGKLANYQI